MKKIEKITFALQLLNAILLGGVVLREGETLFTIVFTLNLVCILTNPVWKRGDKNAKR